MINRSIAIDIHISLQVPILSQSLQQKQSNRLSPQTKMPKSTVFITGATGFIGAHVALSALKAGYNIKLSVRREAQIESLRQALGAFTNNVDFVVVPDYTSSNAFDNALASVDYVIHVASPLAKPNEDLLTPAVKGTTSILESASRTPSVKKVVITASVASLIPLGKGGDGITVKGKTPHPPTTPRSSHLTNPQNPSQPKTSTSTPPSFQLSNPWANTKPANSPPTPRP